MATPNFAKKNPFMGMTVAQMKAYYDKQVRGKKLSAKELKAMADQMQAAKKAALKAKPAKKAASKPRQTTRKEAEARFYSSSSQGSIANKEKAKRNFFRSSSQGSIAKNEEKARSNFFRSSSGTRGQNMPSQPKLKSKPKRSDYPAGRSGQSQYAAALRRHNKPATNRTSRAIRNFTDRRRARRSTRLKK